MMPKQFSKMGFGNKMWGKGFVLCFCLIFGLALLIPSAALSRSEKLIDDNEYKDKDFHKGIITDYTDMVKGDDVDWVWVKPGETLSQYKVKLGNIENKSDMLTRSLTESVKSIFEEYFANGTKGGKGTLTADLCITEVQKFSPGKAWIPFAGGKLMQAGMGVEIILFDQNKTIVAKLRHFDRQGQDVRSAAEEVAGHMTRYITMH
jgi:hypothetical protein